MIRLFTNNNLITELKYKEENFAAALPAAAWIDARSPTEEETRHLESFLKTEMPDADEYEEIENSARCYVDHNGIHVSIQQNKIIKIFSIAAVVFLPPTLVASIYGMNFTHMPELEWTLGYPVALVLMIIAGIAPYWYFKRKGWL